MPRHSICTLERWVAIYPKKKSKESLYAVRKARKLDFGCRVFRLGLYLPLSGLLWAIQAVLFPWDLNAGLHITQFNL